MRKRNSQRGLSTLEYCAVAAIIITITWFGMRTLGTGLRDYLEGIAEWATEEGDIVRDQGHGR